MFESRFRRLPPGAGSLPLEEFREAIATTGYHGVVSGGGSLRGALARFRPRTARAR